MPPTRWLTMAVLAAVLVAMLALATTDTAFAAVFVLSLVALMVHLQRPTWLTAGSLAVALGIALATKYSAIGLFV